MQPGAPLPATAHEIPRATIGRLPRYLRVLRQLAERGTVTVSSRELAELCGVNPAQLRRDLSHFGTYGTRGVGYDVAILLSQIGPHVGADGRWPVIIVGVGRLGSALAGHMSLWGGNFELVGVVDTDPDLIGTRIGGVPVSDEADLDQLVSSTNATFGILTTPPAVAQEACDRLVAAGITSILNFAPTVLTVPDGVRVRHVDLAQELLILAFHEQHRDDEHHEEPAGADA